MSYMWIETENVPKVSDREPLLLFGAGEGSVELLRYFEEQLVCPQVIAVADNDRSMWGREFVGVSIIDPAEILDRLCPFPSCRIIITTVSGRDAVAAQLEAMGLCEGRNFVKVGCYPSNAMDNLRSLLDADAKHGFLANKHRVLHVGPGGFLGLECALCALGYEARAIDAFGFSMRYPDVSEVQAKYTEAKSQFLAMAGCYGRDPVEMKKNWEALFLTHQDQCLLDTRSIDYLYPYLFSELPLEGESVDVVLSFDVLEHVRRPKETADEILRVLRPGGFCFHRILTRDHRSFSVVDGYTPVSYAQYSSEGWDAVNSERFYQNRILPFQWEELFKQKGFEVLAHTVLDHYGVPDAEYASAHASFRTFPRERLEEVNCKQLLRKPVGGCKAPASGGV